MTATYDEFLAAKAQLAVASGLEVDPAEVHPSCCRISATRFAGRSGAAARRCSSPSGSARRSSSSRSFG
jgi:hypothetical protein